MSAFPVNPMMPLGLTANSLAVASSITDDLFRVSNSPLVYIMARIPRGYFSAAGTWARITGGVTFSTTGTPTLTFRLKELAVPTTLFDGGAISGGTGVTNRPASFDYLLTCRTPGSGGSLHITPVQHRVDSRFSTQAAGAVSLDLTRELQIGLSLQWSASSASNTAIVTDWAATLRGQRVA